MTSSATGRPADFVTQSSSSVTGTRRLRPRRISRNSGATFSSKKSGPTPMAAAASAGVSAIRGIEVASFLAMLAAPELPDRDAALCADLCGCPLDGAPRLPRRAEVVNLRDDLFDLGAPPSSQQTLEAGRCLRRQLDLDRNRPLLAEDSQVGAVLPRQAASAPLPATSMLAISLPSLCSRQVNSRSVMTRSWPK